MSPPPAIGEISELSIEECSAIITTWANKHFKAFVALCVTARHCIKEDKHRDVIFMLLETEPHYKGYTYAGLLKQYEKDYPAMCHDILQRLKNLTNDQFLYLKVEPNADIPDTDDVIYAAVNVTGLNP